MSQRTFNQDEVEFAISAFTILDGQVKMHRGIQKEWFESMGYDAAIKSLVQYLPAIDEVWKLFDVEEQRLLGKDVFLGELLAVYTQYRPGEQLISPLPSDEVATAIKDDYEIEMTSSASAPTP